jgi:hypothetical protein
MRLLKKSHSAVLCMFQYRVPTDYLKHLGAHQPLLVSSFFKTKASRFVFRLRSGEPQTGERRMIGRRWYFGASF